MDPIELPVIRARTERADAARNRAKILTAAQRLFERDGVACTSMEAIAVEAGVGKGTLFRRFGDRASLALALLESSDRSFQEAFIRGRPPLGPGAEPCERLIAFGKGLLSHIDANGEILLAAQAAGGPGRRFDVGPYGAYWAHVKALVEQAAGDLDAEYAADSLLSTVSAEVVLHQLRGRGMSLARLEAGWEQLVRGVLGCPPPPANPAAL